MVKKKRQIVIESSGLFILGLLFFVASGLVFYLGASYGKSTRIAKTQSVKQDLHQNTQAPDIDKLAVLNIKDGVSSIKEYEKKLNSIDESLKKISQTTNKPANIDAIKAEDIISVTKVSPNTAEKNLTKDESLPGYTIQVAAMQDATVANDLLNKLRKDNFDAYISALPKKEVGIIYRVRVGSNLTSIQAKSILPTLEKKFAGLSVPTIEQYSY